jgi:hypothetical protein
MNREAMLFREAFQPDDVTLLPMKKAMTGGLRCWPVEGYHVAPASLKTVAAEVVIGLVRVGCELEQDHRPIWRDASRQ